MALPSDMWAAVTGVLLIVDLTRRLAGIALVIIAGVFVAYSFLGPWLPGILEHRGYAAIIPAIIYFVSVFFMVDLSAQKFGMTGLPRADLPKLGALLRQIYLFTPIVVLIYALFAGYSVIRCGTLAMITAAVVSWLTPNKMGLRQLAFALELGARMTLQLVAVCATAGIINLGVEPLVAHFFIFYFAVMSAITPPVALAAYAGAALCMSAGGWLTDGIGLAAWGLAWLVQSKRVKVTELAKGND